MIINVTGNDECRIAITEGGRLEELFIERQSAESHVGNIYKGRVTNVEPSIQAAFVDFGFPKNGFLHVSDVQPQYFPNSNGQPEAVGKKVDIYGMVRPYKFVVAEQRKAIENFFPPNEQIFTESALD